MNVGVSFSCGKSLKVVYYLGTLVVKFSYSEDYK